MKNVLLFVVVLSFGAFPLFAQNTDLPAPAPNLQTLPLNSYIIAMDNTYQVNSSALFNLPAYGLVVYLLNNDIKVKWVIMAGKAKDGIDFTVVSDRIKPTLNATTVSRSFKSGPFVIFSTDTTGVAALIDAFYAANGLTGSRQPFVYRNSVAVTVDVRYDLTGFKPMAAILNDGGNRAIHLAFMSAAAIPASNYTTITGDNLLSSCYTFASEPHNSKTGTAVNTAISNMKVFVNNGGNLLAQCAAVPNYENNVLGRFQTTTGITVSNTAIGTTVLFPNPDLSFNQFEGAFNGSLTGSVRNWEITDAPANGEHNHVTGTGANTSVISASVSKMVSGKGGLVFYLGNHDYSTADIQNINGIRMYMNAFLTPAIQVCPSMALLPLSPVTQPILRTNHQPVTKDKIALLANPVISTLTFNYMASARSVNEISIYSTNGAKVFATNMSAQKGSNSISLTLNRAIPGGLYLLEIANNKERTTAKFIKQ